MQCFARDSNLEAEAPKGNSRSAKARLIDQIFLGRGVRRSNIEHRKCPGSVTGLSRLCHGSACKKSLILRVCHGVTGLQGGEGVRGGVPPERSQVGQPS